MKSIARIKDTEMENKPYIWWLKVEQFEIKISHRQL